MGIEIRAASADDATAIADGLARSIGRADATGRAPEPLRERVRWAFEGGRDDIAGAASLVAIDSQGHVVAHQGAVRIPMLIRGERRTFGRRFAGFVSPDFLVGGVHSLSEELDAQFAERFEGEGGIEVLVGRVQESDLAWLRTRRGSQVLATMVELVRPAAPLYPADAAYARSAARDGLTLLEGDDALHAGWTVPIPPGDARTYRDGSLQALRTSGPYAPDRSWCAVR